VNGEGGDIRGLELVYQQQFSSLPAPFDGLGIASNYAYTTSNIKEQTPVKSLSDRRPDEAQRRRDPVVREGWLRSPPVGQLPQQVCA
jgi:hypothetical protein